MKKTNLFLGALSLLAFAACSDDKPIDEPVQGDDTYAYIKVNILTSTPGGRAVADEGNFEDGDASKNENDIQNLVMVFYGAQGNYLSSASMANGEITLEDATNDEQPNVEKIKSAKAKVSLSGGTIPSYMMVFANPVMPTDIKWSLSAMHSQTRESYEGSNGKFAMNNSVYFGTKPNYELNREIQVSKANFYTKDSEESSATEVDVYLERLAAKVRLHSSSKTENTLGSQSGELSSSDPELTKKTLNFVVEGWGVNATAKKCNLSKCFHIGDTEDYNTVNNQLKTKFEDWNDSERNRSYWAISPEYAKPVYNVTNTGTAENPVFKYEYPYVSDQVSSTSNKLNYYGHKDFVSGGSQHVEVGNSTYTLENTRHSEFYNNTDYKNSALVSAVVVGYYTVGGEKEDFYVQGTNIYLEEEFYIAMAKAAAVIVKSNGSALTKDDADAIKSIFEIYHPTKPNIGDAQKGVEENKVTLRIKNSLSGSYAPDYSSLTNYKFKDGSSAAEDISAENIDRINAAIYSNCGLSSKYKEGKAYFNIPIRHLATAPGANEAWAPGSYGVVRNHIYDIAVDGFATLSFDTLGEGVRDPEDPIVPPTDPSDKYGIKAKIRVLSWRLVKQNVTLGQK